MHEILVFEFGAPMSQNECSHLLAHCFLFLTVAKDGCQGISYYYQSSRHFQCLFRYHSKCLCLFLLRRDLLKQMLFYPIEYFGINLKRWEDTPYGVFGWQGVVPTKTGKVLCLADSGARHNINSNLSCSTHCTDRMISLSHTEIMAKRLVKIVTDKLLSLDEAFARLGV